MPVPNINYPLDLTGQASTNRITNEVYNIASTTRAFVPVAGPFFTTNLEVRLVSGNQLLFPNVHYKALHLYRDVARRAGKEVCSVIYVYDPNIAGDISLTYSCVGGEYSTAVTAIQEILDEIDLSAQPVTWGAILNKPDQFPPTDHLQNANTLYGFDDLIAVTEGVRQAILYGDQHVAETIFHYVDTSIANKTLPVSAQTTILNSANQALASHVAASSAHTPTQVGLGNVQNWAPGTNAEHTNGAAQKYATTAGVKTLFDTIGATLAAKALKTFRVNVAGGLLTGGGDLGSPSNATSLSVGLEKATAQELTDGLTESKVVVPKVLKPYTTGLISTAVAAHKAEANPHTAAQIGLGNVPNFAKATSPQGIAGTADNLFMTPLTTKAAIDNSLTILGTMGRRNIFISSLPPDPSVGAVDDVYITL